MTSDYPAYPFMRDSDEDGVVCQFGSRGVSPACSPTSRRASDREASRAYIPLLSGWVDHRGPARRARESPRHVTLNGPR